MVAATLGSVIGTGLALGIVHVLTGPDHLSALATLSVGKTWRAAFGLGVRWGCGHSFGLLVIAIIFFAVGRSINLDKLTYWADMFVGFFMIVLGLWYILKAWKDRHNIRNLSNVLYEEQQMINQNNNSNNNYNNDNQLHTQISLETIDVENSNNKKINSYQKGLNVNSNNNNNNSKHEKDDTSNSETTNSNTSTDTGSSASNTGTATTDTNEKVNKIDETEEETDYDNNNQLSNDPQIDESISKEETDISPKPNDAILTQSINNNDNNSHNTNTLTSIGNNTLDDDLDLDHHNNETFTEETERSVCLTRLMAFVAGIFHGIAGPGGVLGVMVALRLDSWVYSSLYMITFFISSILTMGLYAIGYGYSTARITLCATNKVYCAFILKIVSAMFSIIVGILWLTLTFTGTLDQIFE